MTGDVSGWTVVMSDPGSEEKAAGNIAALGYEPLLFRYRKLLRGIRLIGDRRVRTRQAGTVVERPLIRGYLFVEVPFGDKAPAIDGAEGVKRFFRHPPRGLEELYGPPKYVRAREIEGIRQAVRSGIYNEIEERGRRMDLREGDQVRTPAGIAGRLLGLDDKGRAELLTEMLGGPRVIRDVDARTLELVTS